MGSIYKRGDTFWIKYYRNGKPYRESNKSKKEADAKRLLKKREGEIAGGKLPGIYFDKVFFDELAEDFIKEYRINNKKSVYRAENSVEHLKTVLEGVRVPDITTPRIQAYIETRKAEEAANATINRELSALKRMLNLGAKQHPPKVDRVPHIPMLTEDNARQGFFEYGDFIALRTALPSHLKGFVTFGYKTGMRISEIAKLTWDKVNRDEWYIRLESTDTKNKHPRTIYLDDELKEVFRSQWTQRKEAGKLLPYVFTNGTGTDRIKRFDKAWKKACKDAKIGIRHFHDFRRSAVRNMVRAGIPEKVAMRISGHKTRSVFDRSNIVDEKDLQEAATRQAAYLQTQVGTVSGTIHDFKKRALSATI
jgi:integrase